MNVKKLFSKTNKFFNEVKQESKRISWISIKEMLGYLRMIIIVMVISSLLLFVLDLSLRSFFKIIVSTIEKTVFK